MIATAAIPIPKDTNGLTLNLQEIPNLPLFQPSVQSKCVLNGYSKIIVFFPPNCRRKTISHPSRISKKHTAPGCSHGETCSQCLQCHFSTCSSMKRGNLGPRPFVHVAE